MRGIRLLLTPQLDLPKRKQPQIYTSIHLRMVHQHQTLTEVWHWLFDCVQHAHTSRSCRPKTEFKSGLGLTMEYWCTVHENIQDSYCTQVSHNITIKKPWWKLKTFKWFNCYDNKPTPNAELELVFRGYTLLCFSSLWYLLMGKR